MNSSRSIAMGDYDVHFNYVGYLRCYVYYKGSKIGERALMVDWLNYPRAVRWSRRYIRRHARAVKRLETPVKA